MCENAAHHHHIVNDVPEQKRKDWV